MTSSYHKIMVNNHTPPPWSAAPAPWQYNMLTRTAGGRAPTRSESCGKGSIIMSTYEEFMIILTAGLLIIAILNLKNKK